MIVARLFQIRSEENPVVLAVCLNGSPGRMEDFELALLGRRVARLDSLKDDAT
jgi:hypothetical protein